MPNPPLQAATDFPQSIGVCCMEEDLTEETEEQVNGTKQSFE